MAWRCLKNMWSSLGGLLGSHVNWKKVILLKYSTWSFGRHQHLDFQQAYGRMEFQNARLLIKCITRNVTKSGTSAFVNTRTFLHDIPDMNTGIPRKLILSHFRYQLWTCTLLISTNIPSPPMRETTETSTEVFLKNSILQSLCLETKLSTILAHYPPTERVTRTNSIQNIVFADNCYLLDDMGCRLVVRKAGKRIPTFIHWESMLRQSFTSM